MALWHPDARRVLYSDAGALNDAPRKLVWHTTEGFGLPTYSGSAPHFTLNPKTGQLWQHIALDRCAKALENDAGGVETNRQGAIQVEIIGFARESQDWSDDMYEELAELARWIERNAGVKRVCTVDFVGNGQTNHMTFDRWRAYSGHCGHQHVPENAHWDPGKLKIRKILDVTAQIAAHRMFNGGEQGPDVIAFQRAVNRVCRYTCRPDRTVDVDGEVGPLTLKRGAWAAWMCGVGSSQDQILENGGIGPNEQEWVRDPDSRSDAQLNRQSQRRDEHARCDDKPVGAHRCAPVEDSKRKAA